jgi:hypothetical protein
MSIGAVRKANGERPIRLRLPSLVELSSRPSALVCHCGVPNGNGETYYEVHPRSGGPCRLYRPVRFIPIKEEATPILYEPHEGHASTAILSN